MSAESIDWNDERQPVTQSREGLAWWADLRVAWDVFRVARRSPRGVSVTIKVKS